MHAYEIEIKSLLGSSEAAERLRARMRELDLRHVACATHQKLSHQ